MKEKSVSELASQIALAESARKERSKLMSKYRWLVSDKGKQYEAASSLPQETLESLEQDLKLFIDSIPAEDICRLMCETADRVTGDKKRFRQAIHELQDLAEADETPFLPLALDLFLARYPASCPAVHHSESYRAAYRPAYRLVLQKKIKDYLAQRRNTKTD